jgi:hypothetical protein
MTSTKRGVSECFSFRRRYLVALYHDNHQIVDVGRISRARLNNDEKNNEHFDRSGGNRLVLLRHTRSALETVKYCDW